MFALQIGGNSGGTLGGTLGGGLIAETTNINNPKKILHYELR